MLLITYATPEEKAILYRIRDLNRWIWHADREIPLCVLCGMGDLTRETKALREKWVTEREMLVEQVRNWV